MYGPWKSNTCHIFHVWNILRSFSLHLALFCVDPSRKIQTKYLVVTWLNAEMFKSGFRPPTLPVPGTSRPSTGRGISMLLTWPYLLHSSLTSSTISSYSSSSRSSSGATMFIRHSTSVGRPPIWVTELFRPGTCSVTGVWFMVVWKKKKPRLQKGYIYLESDCFKHAEHLPHQQPMWHVIFTATPPYWQSFCSALYDKHRHVHY